MIKNFQNSTYSVGIPLSHSVKLILKMVKCLWGRCKIEMLDYDHDNFLEGYCLEKKKRYSKGDKEFGFIVEQMINMLRNKEKTLENEEDDIIRDLAKKAYINTESILRNFRRIKDATYMYETSYPDSVANINDLLENIEQSVKKIEGLLDNGIMMSKILYLAYIETGRSWDTRVIQKELHIGNSHYHRLKNRAIAILAVDIWGIIINDMDKFDALTMFFEKIYREDRFDFF